MAFVTPNTPNLTDFLDFLSESVQIPSAALPALSPWPGYAFNQAMLTVVSGPGDSGCWGWPPGMVPPNGGLGILYTLAVYNCATHLLFMITPDQSGQTYFADARASTTSTNFPNGGFGLNTPSMGLVVSASDEATSSTLKTPNWAAGMTIGQLELFQTPWGRAYLSYAQSYGPTIVGLT
jgi:hypothetical protein